MTTRAERRRQEREAKSAARKIQEGTAANADGIASPLFSEWLDQLRSLPVDAPEWDEAAHFTFAVMTTHADKLAEHAVAATKAVAATLDDIATSFADELRYLEIDTTEFVSPPANPLVMAEAQKPAEELRSALQAYADVRPQASTRNEELERAKERTRREADVMSALKVWRNLMTAPPPEIDNDGEEDDAIEAQHLAKENESLRKANDKLRAESKRLTGENAELARNAESLQLSYDKLRMEKDEQAAENSRLKQEKQDLADQLGALRLGLRPLLEGENPEFDIPSVPAAIGAARQMYEPDRLIIALNSRSKSDTSYKRPVEVYEALDWLATEYYDHHTDLAGSGADFDLLLKQRVKGWFYSAKQSVTAIGKYREEYVTSVDGRKYVLEEHIGEGTRGDPKNMIRIAFDWDSDRRKVVVGYIGPHQQTDAT